MQAQSASCNYLLAFRKMSVGHWHESDAIVSSTCSQCHTQSCSRVPWHGHLQHCYRCAASKADSSPAEPGSSSTVHMSPACNQPGHSHAAQADEHRPLIGRQRQRLEQRLQLVRGRRGGAGAVADQGGGGVGRRLHQVLQVEGVDAVRVGQRNAGLRSRKIKHELHYSIHTYMGKEQLLLRPIHTRFNAPHEIARTTGQAVTAAGCRELRTLICPASNTRRAYRGTESTRLSTHFDEYIHNCDLMVRETCGDLG